MLGCIPARKEELPIPQYRKDGQPFERQHGPIRNPGAKDMYIRILIQTLDKGKPIRRKQILAECPWERTTITRSLQRLLAEGVICKTKHGYYRFIQPEEVYT